MDALVTIAAQAAVARSRALVAFQVTDRGARDSLKLPNKYVDNAGTAKDLVHPQDLKRTTPTGGILCCLDNHVEIIFIQFKMLSRSFQQGRSNGPGPSHSVFALLRKTFHDQAQGVCFCLLPESEPPRFANTPLSVGILIGAGIAPWSPPSAT